MVAEGLVRVYGADFEVLFCSPAPINIGTTCSALPEDIAGRLEFCMLPHVF